MYPQILLLGNGINRVYESNGWGDLIKKLACNPRIDPKTIEKVAYPLQVVLATGDKMDSRIKEKKELFYGLESIEHERPLLESVLRIPFDHILTTNYSYEIERVANEKVKADGKYCQKLARNLLRKEQVEKRYLLHSYNEISFEEHCHKIWHIHGEARKPQSIVLGHYYYGKLLSLYIDTLGKRENKQIERQRAGEAPLIESWLDAFIMGDVYVLGLSFDYSEMDLWWLLNRKKREKAQHGKLYFYEPSEGNEIKHSLLEAYDAKIERLGFNTKPVNYEQFYRYAIEDIRDKALNSTG